MNIWEPVQSIAAGVRAGELDPVELAERAIDRARQAGELGAVVHLDADGARRAAIAVASTREGALAGVPLLVKEIIAVEGLPHRCGSRVFADRVAEADAEVVRLARAAGAVIIGLSHTHEFACGVTGTSNVAGPCRNPHDPTRITGGSSSGSAAAVAAGVVPIAIGTDTAGSVRIPAALCGTVGALPARGTLPAGGVFPMSRTLDRVGVLAASVADARTAVGALAGLDLPAHSDPAPRLGVLADPDCAAEVTDAYRSGLRRLTDAGATIIEVEPPGWAQLFEASADIQGPEFAAVHDALAADGYQPDVVERLRTMAAIPGWRYVRARERQAALAAGLGQLLSTVDALVFPTVPIVAPPIDTVDNLTTDPRSVRGLLLRDNRQLNVTDFPGLSVPLPSQGLPVGLQLTAADNDRAFAVAAWVERALSG